MRRAFRIWAAAVVVLSTAAVAVPAHAQPEGRDHADAVASSRAVWSDSSADVSAAAEALQRTDGAVRQAQAEAGRLAGVAAAARRKYEEADRVAGIAQSRVMELQKSADSAQQAVAARRGELSRFARAAYQAGPLGNVESLLSAQSPEDFQRRLFSLDRVVAAQQSRIEAAAGVSRSYEARSAAAQTQRDLLASARRQAGLALDEVSRAEAEAAAATANLTAASAARRAALDRARVVAQADEARYRQLVSEADRTRSELTGLGPVVVAGAGVLQRPVAGPVTSPYGMRVHPITGVYKLHSGTDFGAACSTPVRAAADGVVSSAAMQPAYGNRVVISHAPLGIATTYNHLSRFAVASGAPVRRGEVIGWVGSTGYSTGCHLHFEVMAAGGYVDPVPWL